MDASPLRIARQNAKASLDLMASLTGLDKGNLSRIERNAAGETAVRDAALLYERVLGFEPWSLVAACGIEVLQVAVDGDGRVIHAFPWVTENGLLVAA